MDSEVAGLTHRNCGARIIWRTIGRIGWRNSVMGAQMKNWMTVAIGTLLPVMAWASDLDDAMGEGALRLSGADLSAIYSGHTWSGKTAKGSEFSQKLAPDGTASLTFKGEVGQGKWRVDGDKGCTSWTKLRSGKEACFAILRMPDGSFAAYDESGTLNSTFDVQ